MVFLGNHDNLGMELMRGHRGLVLTLVSTGLYLALQRFCSRKADGSEKTGITVMRIAVFAGFGLLAVLLVLQIFDHTGLDYSWGNKRGALWHAASVMYRNLPLPRKLFGVGPDCFAMYVSSERDSLLLLASVYDIRRVANAHSELLTMMINIGLSGTMAFFLASFFSVSSAVSALSSKETDSRWAAVIVILTAAGALSHFVVSFQHLLVMPYLFALLGAGGRKR
ncbi:MAG: O-antigen ligase family protein [Solobacterium sp.]|nr:O-antigen ligase family protein [Solobacterium sp.]